MKLLSAYELTERMTLGFKMTISGLFAEYSSTLHAEPVRLQCRMCLVFAGKTCLVYDGVLFSNTCQDAGVESLQCLPSLAAFAMVVEGLEVNCTGGISLTDITTSFFLQQPNATFGVFPIGITLDLVLTSFGDGWDMVNGCGPTEALEREIIWHGEAFGSWCSAGRKQQPNNRRQFT